LTEARELAGSLLPLGEAMGERWGVAALLTIDALAAAELGDIAGATDAAERARARFEEVGDVWGQSLALTAAGIAARGADQPERALGLLDAAASLSEKGHFPVTQSLALVAAGYAHLDRGDVAGAEGSAWRASAVLAGLDLEPHAALGAKVLLAQAMRVRGQREAALAELDAALAVSDQPGLLFPRRQALAHRAGTLLELGRIEEGLETARVAVATPGEDIRSRVLALRALGSGLRASGDEEGARASYDEALAVATSTGQRSEIAATEALIAAG
jgi:tetratricopeptide (TPR) repeat protein